MAQDTHYYDIQITMTKLNATEEDFKFTKVSEYSVPSRIGWVMEHPNMHLANIILYKLPSL